MYKLLSIFFFSFHLSTIFSQNVLYGERNLNLDSNSIFIDKNGFFYPHYPISDSSLKVANNNLLDWYFINEEEFINIGFLYKCNFQTVTKQNCSILNDSIQKSIIKQLNKQNLESTTFLIHGFRKTFNEVEGDRSSTADFKLMIDSHERARKSKTQYIPVYWDAYYDCCFSSDER